MTQTAAGPVCTLSLPMQWAPRADAPDAAAAEMRYRRNLRLLEVVASLEVSQEDAGDEAGPGVLRLSNKLDLLLEMVSLLISDQAPPPPRVSLDLTRAGVAWATPSPPELGDGVDIIIRPHPDLAYDLRVPARIDRCDKVEDQSRVHARFEWTGDLLAAWERWVFRQHRRAVARDRAGTVG